jgi:hypothetical protein
LSFPDWAAAANELIFFDHQHERQRQADAVGEVDCSTVRRQIANGASDAAAVECDCDSCALQRQHLRQKPTISIVNAAEKILGK